MDVNSGANNVLRIWYFYYKWASIFKAHRVGIRVGNYKLQKNALACLRDYLHQRENQIIQYQLRNTLVYWLNILNGNDVDVNNLKLQVKAAQSERDRIGILLSEYLNDPCGSIGQRAVDTRKLVMWNLSRPAYGDWY